MKTKYPAIVFGLSTLVLVVATLGWTNVNIAHSNITVAPTPTPIKTTQKVGCMMPSPVSESTPAPSPSPAEKKRPKSNGRTVSSLIATLKMSDWDCDGVSDYYDNCDVIANPQQEDKNKNGIGDACEQDKDLKTVTPSPTQIPQKIGCMMPTPSTETPTPTPIPTATPVVKKGRFHHDRRTANVIEAVAKEMDWDCDGISNYDDNCLGIYNPEQVDKDKNGIGDACEPKKTRKNKRRN